MRVCVGGGGGGKGGGAGFSVCVCGEVGGLTEDSNQSENPCI